MREWVLAFSRKWAVAVSGGAVLLALAAVLTAAVSMMPGMSAAQITFAVITAVLALVAIGVSVWTRLGAAEDARASRDAAERSATASESSAATAKLSAEASGRSAAVAERVDQRQVEAAEDAAVGWIVVPGPYRDGQTYWLHSTGPKIAWHWVVHMSRTGSSRGDVLWDEVGILSPGNHTPKPLERQGRGAEAYVQVTWQLQDAPGRRITAVYPLEKPLGS